MIMKVLFFLLYLFTVPLSAGQHRISVFVSIPPQKQFVEKIGGEYVDVHVMLPPGESPETYSPSPKMLVSLSSARLYFQIGVPFEKNWVHAIRSVNRNVRIISCCDHLVDTPGHSPDQHDHHDSHIWSSPAYVMLLVEDIKDALIGIDPENAGHYADNYHIYISELKQLDREIQQTLTGRRLDHFIVSHAAWGYFAEQYGLEQISLESNNRESGPRSLLNIIKLAKMKGIRTLFVQEQYKSPALNNLARELDAVTVELDPLAEDYTGNMSIVSALIADALR